MSTQKDIAAALGLTQATVSMALRGDRRISEEVRQKVCEEAERSGYRPNAYVSALMTQIRAGEKPSSRGVIGLLIEAESKKQWYEIESYRIFHQGVLQRGKELGFRIENFFLQQPGMTAVRIDQILHSRGITGIILAPPYHGNRTLNMDWSRYAAVGVGFGWEQQELNRVTYDSQQNYIAAFNELREHGYKRIGTVLGKNFAVGSRHGIKWYTGYLECQSALPENEQIPILVRDTLPPGAKTTESVDRAMAEHFRTWIDQWNPDALLTMVGSERKWLELFKLQIPLACLERPSKSREAGMDGKSEIVGATALELVAAQINRNEFGPPAHPKVTMIEGRWVDGGVQ
jgi:LacI family transcriptional regulator